MTTLSNPAQAFVGEPGTGGAPATDAPDLISAEVLPDSQVLDQQRVRYCFDEALNGPGVANGFFAATYDADRLLMGNSISFDPESQARCVVVTFNNVFHDLKRHGSIGMVENNSVQDTSNRPNYASSAPLEGSTLSQQAGRTTGPDLIDATADSSSNTVTYVFDQIIDDTAALVFGQQFGAVDNSGTPIIGQDADTGGTEPVVIHDAALGQSRVRVKFTDPVTNKIRFFAESIGGISAVRGRAFDFFPFGVAGPSANCGLGMPACLATPAPDGVIGTADSTKPVLVSAERVGNQFILTYSRSTRALVPGLVTAVLDNGNQEFATQANFVTNSEQKKVIVSFPAAGSVAKEASAVVRIVSRSGAAGDINNSSPAPSSVANVGAGAPSRPGYTTAPDLLTTTLDEQTSQAQYNYDEPIDPENVGAAAQYRLLVENGDPIEGDGIGEALDNHVKVLYGADFTAAVGVSSYANTSRDKLGNRTLFGAVSTEIIDPPLPPVANPDSISVAKGSSGEVSPLANDTVTGTPIVTLGTTPAGITASVGPTNVVTVAVSASYAGASTVPLAYTVTDNNGSSNGTITITVTGTGSAPTAVADAATIARGSSSEVDVLANDSFTGAATLAVTGAPTGLNASVTGANRILVSVDSNYAGDCSELVSYSLTTPSGSAAATISVTVSNCTPPNPGPSAACLAAQKGHANAQAAVSGAKQAVTKANKALKKAKKSKNKAKIKKAKKKVKKAKAKLKTANAGLTNALINVGKNCP